VVSITPRPPLPPGKQPPVPTVQEAGWAPEPVWTQRLEEKPSVSVRDRTPVSQSVVKHCTDRAAWLIISSVQDVIYKALNMLKIYTTLST
jgi:hypothetical protein